MRTKNDKGVFERIPMEQRFWEKVDRRSPDECWLWQGKPEKTGYAKITDYWQKFFVHRYSYELAHGPIPPVRWIHVMHSCDVKLCVNPRHLWLGTVKANSAEAVARNRILRGEANPRARLTEARVREIRRRYEWGVVTQSEIAREYGLAQGYVSNLVNRKVWKHVD